MDLEYDKNHPTKKNRPLPSGEISLRTALYLSIGLILFSLLSFFFLPLKFCLILWGYGVLQILYSLWLKKIPIVDIMSIASGFLLRIWAGAILADVPLSHWIILLTFLLANFLALGKRREDLLLHQNGITTRENIHIYTEEFIQQGMQMLATISVVAYIMYTVSQDVIEKFGTDKLFLTSIFVILGFLRYFLVVSAERKIFDPTEILLKDRYLEGVLILWLLSFYFIRKFL
jgi:4-hydroxybenzoate polyprenyltransferase